jgi:hypothetical protein
MSHTSTFDHLPNEIIICIFDYLKPDEKFRSFFDCNDRLRKLVKRYVIYSHRELDKDISRFSTLHSWYKHLSYDDDGETFYLVPSKGEQRRYDLPYDHTGIHWHFWRRYLVLISDERIQQIVQKYPIKLNCSFYPKGSWLRLMKSDFKDFVRRHYPNQFDILATALFNRPYSHPSDLRQYFTDEVKAQLKYIDENEPIRLKKTILEAAQCIWKELQQLDDVNILEIKLRQ